MRDWEGVSRRSTELARVLSQLGGRCVVVGGTARRLRGRRHHPRDLDVTVARADLDSLAAALSVLVPWADLRGLVQGRDASISTGWGQLDVFVVDALPPADGLTVRGVPVQVARV